MESVNTSIRMPAELYKLLLEAEKKKKKTSIRKVNRNSIMVDGIERECKRILNAIIILIAIYSAASAFEIKDLFNAVSKVHFTYGFEFGFIPTGRVVLYEIGAVGADVLNYDYTMYTDLAFGMKAFNFYIKGSSKIPFYPYKNRISLCPFSSFFNFSLGYEKDKFNTGIRHLCAHPVLPAIRYEEIPEMITGGYTEIFIRFGTF